MRIRESKGPKNTPGGYVGVGGRGRPGSKPAPPHSSAACLKAKIVIIQKCALCVRKSIRDCFIEADSFKKCEKFRLLKV
jgi:hypothetical protein